MIKTAKKVTPLQLAMFLERKYFNEKSQFKHIGDLWYRQNKEKEKSEIPPVKTSGKNLHTSHLLSQAF